MKIITFNTKGHDDFIDFLKAYAIICVLFGHTFLWLDKVAYGVWAGMQVPLFILIQSFHAYKRDNQNLNIRKILQRVLIPFFIIEVITFGLSLLFMDYSCNELILKLVSGGGYGPGAYYPWIYLQVALLLPFFSLVLKKLGKITSLIVFLVICEGSEVLCSLVDFPDVVYRVLFIRYMFLFYLGWLWVKDGIRITRLTIVLSIISLGAILYFEYYSINDEPWFYETSWKYHRWPCYFFVANGLVVLLRMVYSLLKKSSLITKCVKHLAESSYEIFLLQMSLIWLFGFRSITFINIPLIQYVVWLSLVWTTSIIGGIMLNKLINRIKTNKVN